MQMKYENVIIQRKGHVATVRLNRPEKLNILSTELMREIIPVADVFSEDEATRAGFRPRRIVQGRSFI